MAANSNADSLRSSPPATDDRTGTDLGTSVVIPTYNEAANVLHVVERCRETLADRPYEVIVVDDDSPDGTWRVVSEEYDDDRVQVIRRTDDKGLATAVVRGFREATHDLCAVMDADLQHPPERLPDLIDAFDEDTDVVIGSRHVDGGGIENWPIERRVVSRGARLVTKLCLPQVRDIDDPLSGFFVVRREILDDVTLSPSGYKILLEVLARCPCDGVTEVPYVFTERQRGSSNLTAGEYLNFLRHVATLRPDPVVEEDPSATDGRHST
jgi:dolichol-phosphate mannosyltransferase